MLGSGAVNNSVIFEAPGLDGTSCTPTAAQAALVYSRMSTRVSDPRLVTKTLFSRMIRLQGRY